MELTTPLKPKCTCCGAKTSVCCALLYHGKKANLCGICNAAYLRKMGNPDQDILDLSRKHEYIIWEMIEVWKNYTS